MKPLSRWRMPLLGDEKYRAGAPKPLRDDADWWRVGTQDYLGSGAPVAITQSMYATRFQAQFASADVHFLFAGTNANFHR